MINSISRILLTCLLVVGGITNVYAQNLYKVRKSYRNETGQLFEQKKWLELESRLNESRSSRESLKCGYPVLPYLFAGTYVDNHLNSSHTDAQWEQWYQSLDEWQKTCPNSVNLPSVRINFWTSYAWKARGGGWASEVTEDGWKGFRQRLSVANEIFSQATSNLIEEKYPCPEIYSSIVMLSLGESWSSNKIDRLIISPTLDHYPYYDTTFTKLVFGLEPKWGGDKGDNFRFYKTISKRLAERLDEDQGRMAYARMLLEEEFSKYDDYDLSLVDWPELLQGMMLSIKKYPQSAYFTERSICFTRTHHGEKAYQTLMGRISNEVPEALENMLPQSQYGRALALELKNDSPNVEFEGYQFDKKQLRNSEVTSITTYKSADSYIVSHGSNGIREISFKTGEPIQIIKDEGRYTNLVRLSNDETKLLSVSAYDKNRGHPGASLKIYEKSPDNVWSLFNEMIYPSGGKIEDAQFSNNDDKVLFVYRGIRNRKTNRYDDSKLLMWDLKSSKKEAQLVQQYPTTNTYLKILNLGENFFIYNWSIQIFDSDQPIGSRSNSSYEGHNKPEKFIKLIQLKDKKTIVGLTWSNKQYYLVSLSAKTGAILNRKSLIQFNDDVTEIELVYNPKGEPFIATCGASGSVSIWKINDINGSKSFSYDSTATDNGYGFATMKSFKSASGTYHVLQGKLRGSFGVFTVK